MAKLIVEVPASHARGSIGGAPLAEATTRWPMCRTCGGPMQFLAQLPLDECGISELASRGQHLLMFQCGNDPGMCDEWDANGGGNAALLVSDKTLQKLEAPPGPTLLDAESPITFQEYDDSRQDESPDDAYCQALEADRRVLGKVGGRPLWIQNDETPSCDCGAKMMFVAQLENHGGGGINFGDSGAGYAFACPTCPRSAKFLFQCC